MGRRPSGTAVVVSDIVREVSQQEPKDLRIRRRATPLDDAPVYQLFLDRPGNDAIQLDLLYNYQSNVALYDGWHEYFRNRQPRMLIVWGKNDPYLHFSVAEYMKSQARKGALRLLEAGHWPQIDAAAEVARLMLEEL